MRSFSVAWFAVVTSALVNCLVVNASVTWDVDANGKLTKNGAQVVLRGFSTTCMEYLLRGIGTKCLTSYNFNNPAQIITNLNREELDNLYSFMLPAPAGVQPSIRLTLNAGYYLDVSTPQWAANRAKFPNLSFQYKTLIESVVADATSKGLVVIMDLHWNDDVTEQEEMALKGSGTANTGDSLTFWNLISAKFANNPLVWYELYNEPHAPSVDVWLNGNAKFEGMKSMAATVRANNIKGMILIAGAFDFAYDADSLVRFTREVSVDRVLFVFHPYMGPLQQGDPGKSATGFASRLATVLTQTKRPVVVTELGQFCCASEGACFQYPGTFNGQSMGYVRALLTEMQSTQTSWTAWAYRPNDGLGDCNQPDMNDGRALYASAKHNNQGANWISLYPTFYKAPLVVAPTVPSSLTRSPTIPSTNSPTTPTKAPTTPTKAPMLPLGTTATPTTNPPITNSPTSDLTQDPPNTPANSGPPVGADADQSNVGGAIAGGVFGSMALAGFLVMFQRRRKNQLTSPNNNNLLLSQNPMYAGNNNV